MEQQFRNVFTPIKIGSAEIPNRVVLPGISTNFSEADGSVGERFTEFYAERAKGGVGLIIVEGAEVTNGGKGLPVHACLTDHRFIPGLRDMTDKIHQYGTKVAIQLHHSGRQAQRAVNRWDQSVAPSAIPCPVCIQVDPENIPRELTVEDIDKITTDFSTAALRAQLAGFDAVEVHAAHGYLIGQFLSPLTNKRSDEYGGSFENRMRFALEIIKKIKTLTNDLPIIFRLTADEGLDGGVTIDLAKKISVELEKAGVNAINVSAGIFATLEKCLGPIYYPKGYLIPYAEEIKKVVNIPVIGVSRISNLGLAEEILSEGKADLVAVGRALVADPHLVKKSKKGNKGDIRPCMYCNYCVSRVLGMSSIKCAVNVDAGRERNSKLEKAEVPKNVMIIGGGPAGMEAALNLCRRGHEVNLYEKLNRLGGQLPIASLPPGKADMNLLGKYLESQIRKAGVNIFLESEATEQLINKEKPDVIIVAAGGVPYIPKLKGIENHIVCLAEDVLTGKVEIGERTIIIGGELVGCEVAHYISEKSNASVCIMRRHGQMAEKIERFSGMVLLRELESNGVELRPGIQYEEITENGILILNKEGRKEFFEADNIVLAAGSRPNNHAIEIAKSRPEAEIYIIGDNLEPRNIQSAIHEGAFVGREI